MLIALTMAILTLPLDSLDWQVYKTECYISLSYLGLSPSFSSLSLSLPSGIPEPPTNVHLSLINQTNILVTWNAPPEVEAYVVSSH